MNTSRLEAFSDGVMAVIITLMALELKAPHGATLASLKPTLPTFAAYAISFSVIGTYWNNHHHLLRAAKQVHHSIMWFNLHLLFWLSLIPFMTAWLGENYKSAWPTAVYAVLLLIAALAYMLLLRSVIKHGGNPHLRAQIGNDAKGIISPLCYLVAIPLAFVNHWASDAILVAVSLAWFIPDRRLVSKNVDV